ncbi:MAG TPA: radical SAM protein [Burkholderiales bacterium]|nr:radical SAM protein [Burkholderiales bacterium]
MNLAEAPPLALPGFVQIEPVGQCNLACRMCPVAYRDETGRGKPQAFMSFETFRRLLDEFPAVSVLQLQGLGEPMLHPRFFDMVRYAAGKGITVSTNSNLTALSERRAEECVTSGLARLYVSLDAAGKAAYEYIRTGARFERVLRNLRRVLAARKRLGGGPEVHLVAVAMRRNLRELPALVRLAHDEGVDGLSVQHLCHDFREPTLPGRYAPMRAFVDAETLAGEAPEAVSASFAEARRLAQALRVPLRLPNERNLVPAAGEAAASKRGLRCDWPWQGAYVSYRGDAMPCCMVATPDRVNFGNMAREGVRAVWENDAYQRFRARLASDEPPDICRGCALYNGRF